MLLIPVVIRPCDWQTAPFARFQALPDGAKPVTSWRPRDRAWANVAAGLRNLIEAKRNPTAATTAIHNSEMGKRQIAQAFQQAREATDHADRRHKRLVRQVNERRMNLLTELPHLHNAVAQLVAHIAPEFAPTLSIEGERLTIVRDRIRMVVEPSDSGHNLTVTLARYDSSNGITFLGIEVMVHTVMLLRNVTRKWRVETEHVWRRELTDNVETWIWSHATRELKANTEELASLLLRRFADRCAGLTNPDNAAG